MTLTELINQVYVLTARPDLVNETLTSIQEATMTVHTVDVFYKDVTDFTVIFDQPGNYIQTLDTTTIPRFRDIAYIRKTNSSLYIPEQLGQPYPAIWNQYPPDTSFFTSVDIADIIDLYGYERQNIWYQAGRQINIKSNTALAQVMAGILQFPQVGATDDQYQSWVAEDFPYAIIYRATGNLFAITGDSTNFAIYMRPPSPQGGNSSGGLYYQQLDLVIKTNITAGTSS